MAPPSTPETIETEAVRQAAAIVDATIRQLVATSLRAAEVCGCRTCRARAARTFQWAVVMLGLDEEREA